jgi:hypothetical protein
MIRRTSLNLDIDLLRDAREQLGTSGTTDTVHRALAEVLQRGRLRRLARRTFDDLSEEALADLRSPGNR